MREEDRIKLPPDYTGVIDPLATVIRFDRRDQSPMLFVTHYRGHPVIAYNLEQPVANPDYSGWAIINLETAYAKASAVGVFLQGCAGDINAKGMFSGPELARESGDTLGRVFIEASRHTRKLNNARLGFAAGTAHVPYGPLPPLDELEKEKEELIAFQKRVDAGDPDTLHVIGYNFSETMRMGYRRNLATPFLRWTDWPRAAKERNRAPPRLFAGVHPGSKHRGYRSGGDAARIVRRHRAEHPEAQPVRLHGSCGVLECALSGVYRDQRGGGKQGVHVRVLSLRDETAIRQACRGCDRGQGRGTAEQAQKAFGVSAI
jgi:hypothetical protein